MFNINFLQIVKRFVLYLMQWKFTDIIVFRKPGIRSIMRCIQVGFRLYKENYGGIILIIERIKASS